MAACTETGQIVWAERRHGLALWDAGCTLVTLESLARKEPAHMNGIIARVGEGNPGIAWNKYDRARTSDGALVADSHSGSAFLQNDDLFGVVVLVK